LASRCRHCFSRYARADADIASLIVIIFDAIVAAEECFAICPFLSIISDD
jgi:hypothetical protein